MKISLCMIVKNEQEVIARCINSVIEIIDEIIIVDTGSTDDTVDIVKELGAKVYEIEWEDNFAKARNYAFSKATNDYILWLDADDILNPNDIGKFKKLKDTLDDSIDAVTMSYILAMDDNGNILNSLRRNRLVKRDNNFQWIGEVHEYLNVYGKVFHSEVSIIHKKEKEYTSRNLKIYEKMIEKGKELSVRDIYYYANELYDNGRYDEAIEQYIKFLDTKQGWIEDIKGACNKLVNCYFFKKDEENELKYLLKSFEYDIPRPDFCCKLGYKFLNENKYDQAIFWYSLAINTAPSQYDMTLINHDTYTYLPWIQLCVCHAKKGDFKAAYLSNEMAGKYKPNDIHVIRNREFLKDKVDTNLILELQKNLN